MKKKTRDVDNLRKIFKHADPDHGGCITKYEFKRWLSDKKVRTSMGVLELDICPSDVDAMFSMLDHGGDGKISAGEFLQGVMRLRGTAKTVDLMKLHEENRRCSEEVDQIHREIRMIGANVEQLVHGTTMAKIG